MQDNEIIIIDAGVIFPEEELRGIDYVLPDWNFLKKNEKKIKTLIITHGHEDHIGAIPFLLQNINIPSIFAPNQAAALIRKKLDEKNIFYKGLKVYKESDKLKFNSKNITLVSMEDNEYLQSLKDMLQTSNKVNVKIINDYDYLKVINYALSKQCINPHSLVPIYLKKIDAEKKKNEN